MLRLLLLGKKYPDSVGPFQHMFGRFFVGLQSVLSSLARLAGPTTPGHRSVTSGPVPSVSALRTAVRFRSFGRCHDAMMPGRSTAPATSLPTDLQTPPPNDLRRRHMFGFVLGSQEHHWATSSSDPPVPRRPPRARATPHTSVAERCPEDVQLWHVKGHRAPICGADRWRWVRPCKSCHGGPF